MPSDNKDIEDRITKALESLHTQSKPNITKTAQEFAVPRGRLHRRWHGGKSLFKQQPNGRKLNSAQELALCEYINYFDKAGDTIFSTPKTAEKVRKINGQMNKYSPSSLRFQQALDKLQKGGLKLRLL
ncbi:transcriptional regulator family: Centromere protein B DNA-binding region [Penicillium taxi]|uniref:transcriptional regulator family: Centromere protein B DNA-binding region n=1 Tax=Penicillium taxi TaxID=168475 RepID=UPI0025458017|nr:transcriptional regulator family: Centromere protein B DNA-binding region [Penicillium taxi]KAJ5894710.1 transcriptional regulator family: Centromere protein B DNA-binding region [Penicillium taxi]